MNVVDIKSRKNHKQLVKVSNDLTQILHILDKTLPLLRPHARYAGMKDLIAKAEATETVLQYYAKRVREALNVKND